MKRTNRAGLLHTGTGRGEKHKQKEQLNFQVFRHKSLYCVLTLQLHHIKKDVVRNTDKVV